jgi:hypothetical protein
MNELKSLQIPAQKYLQLQGIKYIHLQKTTNRKYDTNKTLKGLPDLIVFLKDGLTLLIEFKQGKNLLSEDQKEWRDYFIKNRYSYCVLDNLEGFCNLIDNLK